MGARARTKPASFCSGRGQLTISQEQRAQTAKNPNETGRLPGGSTEATGRPRKHRRVVVEEEEDEEEAAVDEETEEVELEEDTTQATQIDESGGDEDDEIFNGSSLRDEAVWPNEIKTGARAFIEWYIERYSAPPETFTDDAQVLIMNSVCANPMDILCPMPQIQRRHLILAFLTERKIQVPGPKKGDPISSKTAKQYFVDISHYLHHWQSEDPSPDSSRQLQYGDWDYRHLVFKPIQMLIKQKGKFEDGLQNATVPLNLADNPNAESSILNKMGHHAASTPPEHVELVRMWIRAFLKWSSENNYENNQYAPHRGELRTSGFSDFLYFSMMLLAIDVGSNAG